jgi:hypothetical protein
MLMLVGAMLSAAPRIAPAERYAVGAPASAPQPEQVAAGNSAAAFLASPPTLAPRARHLSLSGQKYGTPFMSSNRTEAGVTWALDPHVSIQLNYERTSQAPTMPFDHDNGVMTRLRVGF